MYFRIMQKLAISVLYMTFSEFHFIHFSTNDQISDPKLHVYLVYVICNLIIHSNLNLRIVFSKKIRGNFN